MEAKIIDPVGMALASACKCMVRRQNAREKLRVKESLHQCIRPLLEVESPGHDEIRRVPVLRNASAV
jgi:chorismate mutase